MRSNISMTGRGAMEPKPEGHSTYHVTCPECGTALQSETEEFVCSKCGARFETDWAGKRDIKEKS